MKNFMTISVIILTFTFSVLIGKFLSDQNTKKNINEQAKSTTIDTVYIKDTVYVKIVRDTVIQRYTKFKY